MSYLHQLAEQNDSSSTLAMLDITGKRLDNKHVHCTAECVPNKCIRLSAVCFSFSVSIAHYPTFVGSLRKKTEMLSLTTIPGTDYRLCI